MTDWIALMEDHWAWLVFAALLGIGEVLIPGVFLIWIAIAAAITGLAALALPIGLPLQRSPPPIPCSMTAPPG